MNRFISSLFKIFGTLIKKVILRQFPSVTCIVGIYFPLAPQNNSKVLAKFNQLLSTSLFAVDHNYLRNRWTLAILTAVPTNTFYGQMYLIIFWCMWGFFHFEDFFMSRTCIKVCIYAIFTKHLL